MTRPHDPPEATRAPTAPDSSAPSPTSTTAPRDETGAPEDSAGPLAEQTWDSEGGALSRSTE